jgi:hypothetical protein
MVWLQRVNDVVERIKYCSSTEKSQPNASDDQNDTQHTGQSPKCIEIRAARASRGIVQRRQLTACPNGRTKSYGTVPRRKLYYMLRSDKLHVTATREKRRVNGLLRENSINTGDGKIQ